MKSSTLVLLSLAFALLVAGCGGGESSSSATSGTATVAIAGEVEDEGAAMADQRGTVETAAKSSGAANTGTKISAVDSAFGTVIADRRGEALYLFDREDEGKSECYGPCAAVWPPVLTQGAPRAAGAAKQKLLGTTKRADGKLQVTYAGQPLYRYVDDSPGSILCNDVFEFGGLWLVVAPSGRGVS